jgi:hypothetical protein
MVFLASSGYPIKAYYRDFEKTLHHGNRSSLTRAKNNWTQLFDKITDGGLGKNSSKTNIKHATSSTKSVVPC